MTKQIRQNQDLYVAPQMLGRYVNNSAEVLDERNGEILNPLDVDDKIKIYERQVKEWFLHRATRFLAGTKNGFVVLMISAGYIEGVEQYRQGETSERTNNRLGRSKDFFRKGMIRIFSISPTLADELYSQLRCGLFHNGMASEKIIISSQYRNSIEKIDDTEIHINPNLFLRDIKIDFYHYIRELKVFDNNQLRNNFNVMFNLV